MGRDHWTTALAATGHAGGVALLVWGLLAGEPLPILLGLAVVGLALFLRPA